MAQWASAARRAPERHFCAVTARCGRPTRMDLSRTCLLRRSRLVLAVIRVSYYRKLTAEFGDPQYERVDAAATAEQKAKLEKLSPEGVTASKLAGEPIISQADQRSRQQRPDWRAEGNFRQRLVRRAPFWNGEHLQDLRGKFQGPGTPGGHTSRSRSRS